MIQNVKKYLLHLVCVMALLGGMTACEGFDIKFTSGNENGNENTGNGNENGGGNGNENGNGNGNEENTVEFAGCWHLVSLYGAEVDVDIYIDFDNDGKFVIYQRTDNLAYTVFDGTYTVDTENSVISGVYSDGTTWLTSYNYVVDKENKTLTLTSVKNPSEVAVYEASEAPSSATVKSRCALISDVKPL